jgi:hypothetical protein
MFLTWTINICVFPWAEYVLNQMALLQCATKQERCSGISKYNDRVSLQQLSLYPIVRKLFLALTLLDSVISSADANYKIVKAVGII